MMVAMNATDYTAMLACAEQIASAAQLYVARDFRNIEVHRKADESEVTETDLRIQRLTAERLRRRFPDHALLGEEQDPAFEGMPDVATARFCWIVDPLDGTRNYSRGLPCFTTSIAVLEEGRPVVGLIRDLVSGHTYSALRGQGAFAGARRMRVSDRPFDRHSMVSFQPHSDGSTYDRAAGWMRDVHVRNFGTTALHLAFVADGALDGAVCEQNRIWDVAAGTLLIEEAGGVMTNLGGKPLFPCDVARQGRNAMSFIAGSTITHPKLRLT